MLSQSALAASGAWLLIACVAFGVSVRRNARVLWLLTRGVQTRAVRLSAERIDKLVRRVKRRRASGNVYYVDVRFTFEFQEQNGRTHRVVHETIRPDTLIDEREGELLVYDPEDPTRFLLLDGHPLEPRVVTLEGVDTDEATPSDGVRVTFRQVPRGLITTAMWVACGVAWVWAFTGMW